ncbi:MAG: tryptophan synthase subunit alpha, partial [Candidatus Diapherotrites archaeon]|nr:tryptophan synthase subunit alpha [Candidatus Diapherotrites archaeon]
MSNDDSEYAHLFERTPKAFMPYICYGYPNPKQNQRMLETVLSNGADALEIGFPFSDPVADGPILTRANSIALEYRPTFGKLCVSISRLRRKGFRQPITLMMYANTFVHIPTQRLQAAHQKKLLQGLLVPDIPHTEIDTLIEHAPKIPKAFLISDNTPQPVLRQLERHHPPYYYLTAKYGTTGTDYRSKRSLNATIQRIRAL